MIGAANRRSVAGLKRVCRGPNRGSLGRDDKTWKGRGAALKCLRENRVVPGGLDIFYHCTQR